MGVFCSILAAILVVESIAEYRKCCLDSWLASWEMFEASVELMERFVVDGVVEVSRTTRSS